MLRVFPLIGLLSLVACDDPPMPPELKGCVHVVVGGFFHSRMDVIRCPSTTTTRSTCGKNCVNNVTVVEEPADADIGIEVRNNAWPRGNGSRPTGVR